MKNLIPGILSIAILMLAAGNAHAAPVAPSEVGAAAPPIGLPTEGGAPHFADPAYGPKVKCGQVEQQLAVLNPTLTEGEPLLLRLMLRSLQPELEVEYAAQLAHGADLRVNVQPPSGRPYQYKGLNRGSNVPRAVVKMDGFTRFRMDFRLAVDNQSVTGAAFDIPGTYRIQVLMNCDVAGQRPEQKSLGVFEFEVQEAEGEDRTALDILSQDPGIFRAIHIAGAKLGPEIILDSERAGLLERVIREAPQARLTPHVKLTLADYYDKQDRQVDAVNLCREVQENHPGTPMAEDAFFDELSLLEDAERHEMAWEKFLDAWQDPYLTQKIYPKSPMWKSYVAAFLKQKPESQWMIQKNPGPNPEFIERERSGPKIRVSEEVQRQWGLPEVIYPNEAQR